VGGGGTSFQPIALRESVDADNPIHAWLRTFSSSFDERATKIVMDAGRAVHRPNSPELVYEPQIYDSSLRTAAALLDRCLRYRNQMGADGLLIVPTVSVSVTGKG